MTYQELWNIAKQQFEDGIMPLEDFIVIARLVSKHIKPPNTKEL